MSDSDPRDDPRKTAEKFRDLLERYIRMKELFLMAEPFLEDLIDAVSSATYEYFTGELLLENTFHLDHLTEAEFRERFAVMEDILWADSYYTIQNIEYCIKTFSDEEIPEGTVLKYKKIEPPDCSEEAVEARIQEAMKGIKVQRKQIEAIFRESFWDSAITKEFYFKYKKILHNILKELALDYFPEIMELTATGFRELDTLLWFQMAEVHESVREILLTIDEEINGVRT
ncbi:MAG TPA: hypothetical protein VKA68_07180 [bacterium]|nr:hypothetical protein [bacterium]